MADVSALLDGFVSYGSVVAPTVEYITGSASSVDISLTEVSAVGTASIQVEYVIVRWEPSASTAVVVQEYTPSTTGTLEAEFFTARNNVHVSVLTGKDAQGRYYSKGVETRYKIREQILKMEKEKKVILSYIYKETLRSLLTIFGDLYYIDSENQIRRISCSHGNPERAIAKKFQENNIILPYLTVNLVSTEINQEKTRYKSQIVTDKWWDDEHQRAVRLISTPSRPMNLIYSVNAWTRYLNDMDQIEEQIIRMFSPAIEIPTKWSTLTQAHLTEIINDSDFDAPDGEDRLVRRNFSVEVQTYVPSPKFRYTSSGKIEEFRAEIWLAK